MRTKISLLEDVHILTYRHSFLLTAPATLLSPLGSCTSLIPSLPFLTSANRCPVLLIFPPPPPSYLSPLLLPIPRFLLAPTQPIVVNLPTPYSNCDWNSSRKPGNEDSMALPQASWISVCILIKSPHDSDAHRSLRSTSLIGHPASYLFAPRLPPANRMLL